jgi:hypothetical protein
MRVLDAEDKKHVYLCRLRKGMHEWLDNTVAGANRCRPISSQV